MDLFENYDEMPRGLKAVYDFYAGKEELTYEECAVFLKECEAIGYTFEYGLDAQPHNLRRIVPRVVVVVRGGLVSGACSNFENMDVDVLDHDNWEQIDGEHDDEEALYEALDEECKSMHAVY